MPENNPPAKSERLDAATLALVDPATRGSIVRFEHVQREARVYADSQLVPKEFQKNLPNVIIAMELADRIGANRLAVMQSLNIIHGKPSWSSQFIISAINSCGRFHPLRFDISGTGDDLGCICWTLEKEVPLTHRTLAEAKKAGQPVLESPRVSMLMAKEEGWYGKAGSKWKTMPELMMRYRSATFFGRIYAPELLNGMGAEEEVIDVGTPPTPVVEPEEPTATRRRRSDKGISGLKQAEPVDEAPKTETKSEPAPASTPEAQDELITEQANNPNPEPPPATPDPKPAPAAATEPKAEASKAATDASKEKVYRVEFIKITPVKGGVSEVDVKGDLTEKLYHRESDCVLPAAGTVAEITLSEMPSRKDASITIKLIKSVNVLA